MKNKIAIITGISGQDGAYLSQLLLEKGYQVIGLTRNIFSEFKNLDYLGVKDRIKIYECDLNNFDSIRNIIKNTYPTEIYNLAAQSSVGYSFKTPKETINFNVNSVINILESIREINHEIKFYQASSSEMFGVVNELPLTEESILHPVSPYGISKATAHWVVRQYRESYDLFASSGILFNHESFLREDSFFVKKLIKSAIQLKEGKLDKLTLGNLNVKRDFGYSPDYVRAMYLILQQKKADDYVICSGKSIYLKDIVDYVFNYFNLSTDLIEIDENLYRPNEIEDIYGSNEKANRELDWNYNKDFYEVLDELIKMEVNQ